MPNQPNSHAVAIRAGKPIRVHSKPTSPVVLASLRSHPQFSRHENRSSKPHAITSSPEQATEAPPPRSPHLFLSSGCRSTPSLLRRRRLRSPKHPHRGSLLPTCLLFSSVFLTPPPRAAYNFSFLLASDSLLVLGLIQSEQATVYAINFGLETRVSVSIVMILMYRSFGSVHEAYMVPEARAVLRELVASVGMGI